MCVCLKRIFALTSPANELALYACITFYVDFIRCAFFSKDYGGKRGGNMYASDRIVPSGDDLMMMLFSLCEYFAKKKKKHSQLVGWHMKIEKKAM